MTKLIVTIIIETTVEDDKAMQRKLNSLWKSKNFVLRALSKICCLYSRPFYICSETNDTNFKDAPVKLKEVTIRG